MCFSFAPRISCGCIGEYQSTQQFIRDFVRKRIICSVCTAQAATTYRICHLSHKFGSKALIIEHWKSGMIHVQAHEHRVWLLQRVLEWKAFHGSQHISLLFCFFYRLLDLFSCIMDQDSYTLVKNFGYFSVHFGSVWIQPFDICQIDFPSRKTMVCQVKGWKKRPSSSVSYSLEK